MRADHVIRIVCWSLIALLLLGVLAWHLSGLGASLEQPAQTQSASAAHIIHETGGTLMHASNIIRIVCWSLIALLLIAVLVFGLLGMRWPWLRPFAMLGGDATKQVTGEQRYSADVSGIHSLSVSWTSGQVSITPYDGNDITFTENTRHGGAFLPLSYTTDGGVLNIQSGDRQQWLSFGWNDSANLTLYVPKTLAGTLNALSVYTTSADLSASGFTADEMLFETTSGNFALEHLTARRLLAHSVSGDQSLKNIDAPEFFEMTSTSGKLHPASVSSGEARFKSVSGDVRGEDLQFSTLYANTTSGDVDLKGNYDRIEAGSISGWLGFVSETCPAYCKAGTTSGGIALVIPETPNLSVSHSSTSGRFHSDFPVMTGGEASIILSSVSGDAGIYLPK